MAIAFHDGFETGGADAWSSVTGSPTFVVGAAHTGNYGMRCNPSSATAFVDSGLNHPQLTFYLYITSAPDSECIIAGSDGGTKDGIGLKTDRTLTLWDAGTLKDTGGIALDTGKFYRISLSTFANVTKVYLDSVEELTTNVTIVPDGNIGVITSCSADLYFDNIAAKSTSTEIDDMGDIRTLAARPTGEGTDQDLYTTDSDYWAEHTVSDDAVYSEIDDDPPSTSTFNFAQGDSAKTARYSVTLDDCGSGNLSGIGAGDTIEAVNFMWYYETDGGGSDDYGIRIRCSDDAGSPFTNDNIDDPKDPTWLNSYHADTPAGANAWTQAYVNSLEMGMGSITNGGKEQWWYEAYAMVAFKVVSAAVDVNVNDVNPAVTDVTSQYITPYLIEQSDSNPDVTDVSQQYINPYISEQCDSMEVTDYADVSIPVADVDINVADANPDVTDSSSQYITPYLINVADEIGLQDASNQYLNLYEIAVDDDVSISEKVAIPGYIYDVYGLQDMEDYLVGNYILANDIDCSPADPNSGSWDSDEWPGTTGFRPVGHTPYSVDFTGTLDGDGYKITGLYINRPGTTGVGLFGGCQNIEIPNVTIEGATIIGNQWVGTLAGVTASGTIGNCHSSGDVTGNYDNGGLVGYNGTASFTECSSSCDVDGVYSGGLIAEANNGTFNRCFTSGNISGTTNCGGLLASLSSSGIVNDCYATGSVTASSQYAGGLIGHAVSGTIIRRCYSVGAVSSPSNVGGLIGGPSEVATVSDSFWDMQTSGQATSKGGTGKITSEMKDVDTFTDLGVISIV